MIAEDPRTDVHGLDRHPLAWLKFPVEGDGILLYGGLVAAHPGFPCT